MIETRNGLSTEYISHPGDTLLELLEQYGISQKELSLKTQISEKHINEIIKGKKSITISFAKKLENIFKPNASFWMNRQSIYDEKIESLRIIENITEEEKSLINRFPINELVKYGYIEDSRNEVENVLSLRKFTSSSNLLETPNLLQYMISGTSFKTDATTTNSDPYKLYSWLRICQIESESIYNPNTFDFKALRASLVSIKQLSLLNDFNEVYKKLINILYQCGINFRIVKNFQGLNVQGYIRTIQDSVSLCVTIKWHREDVFWFTLFHEFGHLFYKRNNRAFIDMKDDEETEANNFAKDHLIDSSTYETLKRNVNEKTIMQCAKSNGISPAIVVGRLANDKIIPQNRYKYLIRKIVWSDNNV
ncbi:MAG: HigA family addiction module antidote protein [Bacilli bacterium]|nr:HigA family addiction module antidote protein [Bacilli bacterium]